MAPRTIQQVLKIDPEYTRTVDPGRTDPAPSAEAATPPPPAPTEAPKRPRAARRMIETLPDVATVETPPPAAPPRAAASPSGSMPQVSANSRRGARKGEASTERVSVWIRPRQDQVDRIAATGLPPQHVLKAAWRRAAPRCTVGPSYIEPSPVARAEGVEYRFASSLRLDADAVTALARAQDRLGIRSRWSLVCGQVEPLFWGAVDEVLTQIEEADALEKGRGSP